MFRVAALLLVMGTIGFIPAQRRGGSGPAPTDGYQVVRSYPHDRTAFTQGLIVRNGVFYEGTGQTGQSTLRKVKIESGEVLQQKRIDAVYFGEGITELNGSVYQLTWQHGLGFVYDLNSFNQTRTFSYKGEGWGLTHDGTHIIMSDGTAQLRFLDPRTMAEVRRITVTDAGRPVIELNELEYIKGEIYANVWKTERIVRISPSDGKVTGWIDLSGLLSPAERAGVDVLNGIAYDPAGDRIFVTGKWWPRVFEIKVTRK
jgi:glutamine cyclotransferase